MTYWCQKYMAQSKRNHNPKFWSVIQRKETQAAEKEKRQYERDKVMLEMARTSKKISSRNNSAGFKTPSSTRLNFKVF